MRRLDKSRAWTAAGATGERLGLRKFRVLVAAQDFRKSARARKGRLELHPWADNRGRRARERRGAIVRQDWQRRFLAFVKELSGDAVYVTIDLDCLRAEDAITNWENGCFSLDDLEWALRELRHATQIIAERSVRRFLTAAICAVEATFRREDGSSENRATESGGNSTD